MTSYEVEFEIAGPMAMFARPDTGSAPVSYPVPTWSACKAMFESVARGVLHEKRDSGQRVEPAAFFCPTAVEIWRPIRYEKYVTNYRGPLRKPDLIAKEASYQLHATVLVDVCFRVRGQCVRMPGAADPSGNAPHALQAIFRRRLTQQKSKYAPCLGWKEFLPSYFGPTRAHDSSVNGAAQLEAKLTLSLPAFLLNPWDAPMNGRYAPVFRELSVHEGILQFPAYRWRGDHFAFDEDAHAA
jgi:CRISPR-associated protein Cas5d